MSNDLEEIKKLPDYEDLSEYRIEDPEDAEIPDISSKESALEDPIRIKYGQLVNGYTVTVNLFDGGYAIMHFEKGNASFSAEIYGFEEPQLYDLDTGMVEGDEIVLKYIPLPAGKMISENCTIFFSDVDIDGTKELLVKEALAGTRGTNLYHVYELDGTEREDEPFYAICDMTTFNASEKSITQEEYYGVILGSNYLKYRRQPDGSFALTDSTHVDYKVDFTDSIRVHYRKQGDEMVLVKKEVVK